MLGYIYLLKSSEEKFYVGVTTTLRRRICAHLSGHGNRLIKECIQRGISFNEELLFEGPINDCYELEPFYIQKYNALFPLGYNLDSGGHAGGISDRKGSKNTQAILNEEIVLEIRELASNNPNLRDGEIAKRYGVTRESISILLRGDSWKNVGGPIRIKKSPKKVTSEDIVLFKELRNKGETYQTIADKFNRSPATIRKYCLQ